MPEINFRYETEARKVMVDLKFDALYIQVSLHRKPLEVVLVESYPEVCIGGWSCVCQPYLECVTALTDFYMEHGEMLSELSKNILKIITMLMKNILCSVVVSVCVV